MIKTILEQLCAFDNRLTTTDNERKAGEFLKNKLAELGYETTLEEFPSPRTFSWTYLTIYSGFTVSLTLSLFFPLAGIILFLLSLVVFLGEQTTLFAPLTTVLFARGKSQNIIGRQKIREKVSKNRIWLVAHYDTSKTSLAFSPASVPFLRPLFVFSLCLLAGSLAIMLLRLLPSLSQILPFKLFLIFSAFYFFYMAIMMIERELRGKPVQGAGDNATGVAVVMELAKRFQDSPLKKLEPAVLLTGAEEVGMVGMGNFIKRHSGELKPSQDYFINFDSIGQGDLCYITKEGMIFPLKGCERLIQLAEELCQQGKFSGIKGKPYTALTLDSLVTRARGYPVLSFMALTEKNFPQPWHWFDDTLNKVDLAKLALLADFAEQLLRKFDD